MNSLSERERGIIARCAATGAQAVTRWYAEHLYRYGTTLEGFVREEIKKLTNEIKP